MSINSKKNTNTDGNNNNNNNNMNKDINQSMDDVLAEDSIVEKGSNVDEESIGPEDSIADDDSVAPDEDDDNSVVPDEDDDVDTIDGDEPNDEDEDEDDVDTIDGEEPEDADENDADENDNNKKPKIENKKITGNNDISIDILPNITNSANIVDDDLSDTDSEDYDDENYLKKIDEDVKNDYISANHPEELAVNFNEVLSLCKVIRNRDGIIIDPLHKTIPILTKYEYTNILGTRTKQLNSGAKSFIEVKKNIIDGYIIAEMEIKQKKLPFIVQRPLPNGGCEYWPLNELEILV